MTSLAQRPSGASSRAESRLGNKEGCGEHGHRNRPRTDELRPSLDEILSPCDPDSEVCNDGHDKEKVHADDRDECRGREAQNDEVGERTREKTVESAGDPENERGEKGGGRLHRVDDGTQVAANLAIYLP